MRTPPRKHERTPRRGTLPPASGLSALAWKDDTAKHASSCRTIVVPLLSPDGVDNRRICAHEDVPAACSAGSASSKPSAPHRGCNLIWALTSCSLHRAWPRMQRPVELVLSHSRAANQAFGPCDASYTRHCVSFQCFLYAGWTVSQLEAAQQLISPTNSHLRVSIWWSYKITHLLSVQYVCHRPIQHTRSQKLLSCQVSKWI